MLDVREKERLTSQCTLDLRPSPGHLAAVPAFPRPSRVQRECVPGTGGEPNGALGHALSRVPSTEQVIICCAGPVSMRLSAGPGRRKAVPLGLCQPALTRLAQPHTLLVGYWGDSVSAAHLDAR